MKAKITLPVLLGLAAPVVFAAEPPPGGPDGPPGGPDGPPGPRGQMRQRVAEAWEKADANGDGVISKEEFAAMDRVACLSEEQRAAIFQRLDKDGNGSISRGELAGPGENHRILPRLAELDADKDHRITLEEFKAGDFVKRLPLEKQEALFRRLDTDGDGAITPKDRPPPPRFRDPRGLFRALDKDGDGFLSAAEFGKVPMFRQAPEGTASDRFKQTDENGDGKLDEGEFVRHAGRRPGKPGAPGKGEGPPPGPPPEPPPTL